MSSTRATRTRRPRRRSIVDLLPTFERGRPQPLGATVDDGGVNFALFSEEATGVELLLFDAHDDLHPVATIPFDPDVNRSFHFWHVYVRGLTAGLPLRLPRRRPERSGGGHRFDPEKVLLDPYAQGQHEHALEAGRRLPAGRQPRARRCARVDHRRPRLRLGGRPAAQAADERHRSSTSCTSRGFTDVAERRASSTRARSRA